MRAIKALFLRVIRAIRRISPSKALELQKGGAYVVDVRAPGEFSSGHIVGAGLDCQATEPPVGLSKELVSLDNVVALPHCASKTSTARRHMSIAATTSIIDVLEGRTPEFVVNRDVLKKLDLAPRP